MENVENIGIRPIIGSKQCSHLIDYLSKDFDVVSHDWKIRSREYNEKLQSGDVFEAADVLKKLAFLSLEKKLSFREQSLLDKSRCLVVSELVNAGLDDEERISGKVKKLVKKACTKHCNLQPKVITATNH